MTAKMILMITEGFPSDSNDPQGNSYDSWVIFEWSSKWFSEHSQSDSWVIVKGILEWLWNDFQTILNVILINIDKFSKDS